MITNSNQTMLITIGIIIRLNMIIIYVILQYTRMHLYHTTYHMRYYTTILEPSGVCLFIFHISYMLIVFDMLSIMLGFVVSCISCNTILHYYIKAFVLRETLAFPLFFLILPFFVFLVIF